MDQPFLRADHTGLAQPATPAGCVITRASVENATVIPDDGVSGLPGVTQNLFFAGGALKQIIQKGATAYSGHADDRPGMGANVQVPFAMRRVGFD